MDKKYDTGLVIGRFQPFHYGHLFIVKRAMQDCKRVIIAIGSSQESRTKRNPFTAEERMDMIDEVTRNLSPNGEIIAIKFVKDINNPPKWARHVEQEVGHFDAAYITSETDKILFKDAGYNVIDVGMVSREVLMGENIRKLMTQKKGPWRAYVPLDTQKIIDKIDGVKIIKDTQKNG